MEEMSALSSPPIAFPDTHRTYVRLSLISAPSVRLPTEKRKNCPLSEISISQSRFSNTWRTYETHDFPLNCTAKFSYGEDFQDTIVDVLEPVMMCDIFEDGDHECIDNPCRTAAL